VQTPATVEAGMVTPTQMGGFGLEFPVHMDESIHVHPQAVWQGVGAAILNFAMNVAVAVLLAFREVGTAVDVIEVTIDLL